MKTQLAIDNQKSDLVPDDQPNLDIDVNQLTKRSNGLNEDILPPPESPVVIRKEASPPKKPCNHNQNPSHSPRRNRRNK